jgi:hypothetical protein
MITCSLRAPRSGNHYDLVYPVQEFEHFKLAQALVYQLVVDRALGAEQPAEYYAANHKYAIRYSR